MSNIEAEATTDICRSLSHEELHDAWGTLPKQKHATNYDQHNFKVYVRYAIQPLCWEYGTTLLVHMAAPTVCDGNRRAGSANPGSSFPRTTLLRNSHLGMAWVRLGPRHTEPEEYITISKHMQAEDANMIFLEFDCPAQKRKSTQEPLQPPRQAP